MRLWPKSLAGRLAALLVLTLVAAQVATFALFAGERVAAFRAAYRDDLLARLVSLVRLVEDAPPELHDRLAATMSSAFFRVELASRPAPGAPLAGAASLRAALAAELSRPADDIRATAAGRRRGEDRRRGGRHRMLPWATLSIRLGDGRWLIASADRPPVPPLGGAFLASFLLSAVAVAGVGAWGMRRASRPLKQLAGAADRLGRGEAFEPLPERGPLETRQANVAFNRMRERLDRFVRDRTTMIAAVAHDLRTPITTLRLRAEFIDDAESRDRILETLAEMQSMAESMLAFARGDAESEATRPTQLAALVESVVDDARDAGRDARFVESDPLTLACRPHALRRAIGNLVENAGVHGRGAAVRLEADSDAVRILVDDDGPGVPEAELERVFDPFVRLEASRSRATGGAGLGLAIARSIFRAHGGDVKLENRPDGGLRATGTLPRG